MNSGYYMLDFGGLDLYDATEQEIAGIFNRVKTAIETKKPIIGFNVVYNSSDISPISLCVYPASSTKFVAIYGVYMVEIDNDNGVTVTDLTASE